MSWVRSATILLPIVLLAAGCSLGDGGGGGQSVSIPPLIPQAATTYTQDVAIVDAYLDPAKAGGQVVLHATISNTDPSDDAIVLQTITAPSGTATLDQSIDSGYYASLPGGVGLGTTKMALTVGKREKISLMFSKGGAVVLEVPVGGTASP